MPKDYDPTKIGAVQRSYYKWGKGHDVDELDDLLSWLDPGDLDPQPKDKPSKDKSASKDDEKKKKVKHARKFADMVLDHKKVAGLDQVKDFKKASQYEVLMNMLVEVMEDAFYAVSDFVSWRKVKTSLTVLGSIGGGAAIGALLGTFVLPGVGTAIGGTAGAAITSGLGLIGGVVGTSIIGAFAGSWIGKKIADKLFKYEKRFQLSKKVTRKVKKELGVDNDTIDDMNFYLYGLGSKKGVGIQNDNVRATYKKLRREALKKANPVAIQKLGDFFAKELELLMREKENGHISPAEFEQEAEMVLNILKKLERSKLPKDSKKRIAQTLAQYEDLEQDRPASKKAEKQTKSKTKKQKKSVGHVGQKTQHKTMLFDGGTTSGSKSKPKTEYLRKVSATASDEQLAADIIKMFQPLQAQHQETPVKSARISSGGKEELAIQLCAALLIMGIEPLLKESEFPSDTVEARRQRDNIMEEAQKLKGAGFLDKAPFVLQSDSRRSLKTQG